jgi:hypothetical protein
MRIGIAKSQFIFTQMGRSVFMPQGNNRELVSLVETISGARVVIPPMIIVGAKTILEGWCEELPDGYLLNTTESGYSNDVTCLDYIKHFHKQTTKHVKGTWRLLLMDGYDSHHTFEFLAYAESKKIKVFALPPHTSHFLQPLDVGCFQPMKWHHGQALDLSARYGGQEFTKIQFFAALHEICQKTFTDRTIGGGWARTGLIPFNPEKVLPRLQILELAEVHDQADPYTRLDPSL